VNVAGREGKEEEEAGSVGLSSSDSSGVTPFLSVKNFFL